MTFSLGKPLDPALLASAQREELPDRIDIADLRRPVLSELQKAAVAAAAANPVTFSEDAILGAATQATGLTDFGAPGFRKNLSMWVASTRADTELSALGQAGVFMLAMNIAIKRLRVEELVKRFPEILDIQIERPLIIAGLPRSGTTYLQSFLAADPRLRSLPYWEAMRPVPALDEVVPRGKEDPRRSKCAAQWAQQDAMLPYVKAIHEFTPDHISEDIELQTPEYGTYALDWLTYAPVWRDHYFATDQTPGYCYLKKCLQVLNFLTGTKRWLLKCPQHMEQLPVLTRVFPDATIIINHRDPVASIQSAMTGVAYSSRITRSCVRTDRIAEYWVDRYERLLRACVRDRAQLDDARTADVYFHELMADPMKIVDEIYAKAGLPLHAGARQPMEDFRTSNPRGKHGQLVYHLQRDFDLSAEQIRSRFAFYFERFPVRAEVK